MTTPLPEKKKITLTLRCNLTDPEKINAGKELAEATNQLTELENDRKQVADSFKAKITAEDAKVASLSNKVRSGYEFRQVPCLVHFDEPTTGMKRTVRTDTNEQVSVEAMSEGEKQRNLGLDDSEA